MLVAIGFVSFAFSKTGGGGSQHFGGMGGLRLDLRYACARPDINAADWSTIYAAVSHWQDNKLHPFKIIGAAL